MSEKQDTITALRTELERWEAVLSGLSEAQIAAPEFADNWSIKDVVAHLQAWQQRSIARMEAALHDREPNYPDWPEQFDPEEEGQPHDLNAWLYQQSRDLPWASVRQQWRDGFLRFLELSEALDESDITDTNKYAWLEGYALIDVLKGSLEHHREHAEFLEPVLARRGQPGA